MLEIHFYLKYVYTLTLSASQKYRVWKMLVYKNANKAQKSSFKLFLLKAHSLQYFCNLDFDVLIDKLVVSL